MTRIKVCQVLNAYRVGGAETVALDIARNLDRDRFDSMAVAVLEKRTDQEPEMMRRFREAGVPALALYHRSFRDPRTIWEMFRFFRRHHPDIIHGHNRFSDYWACRIGRLAGVPHRIWTRHLVYTDMSERQIGRYRRLGASAPVVIAVSDAVEKHCRETEGIPAERVETIVNGIDTQRYQPLGNIERHRKRATLGVGDHEHMLLQVGRLAPQKAPGAFIALCGELRQRGLEVRGFHCGVGSLRDSLEPAARSAAVQMLGLRSDVPELLAAADLVVSTSRTEGLPLNLMEAMAAGSAFVGPDLPQVQQLVEDHPELLGGLFPAPPRQGEVPAELVGIWAEKTAERIRQPELRRRCGRQAREIIKTRFSVAQMVNSYAEIYRKLYEEY